MKILTSPRVEEEKEDEDEEEEEELEQEEGRRGWNREKRRDQERT